MLGSKEENLITAYVGTAKLSKSEDVKIQMYMSINKYALGPGKNEAIDELMADAQPNSPRAMYAKSYFDAKRKAEEEQAKLAKIALENAALAKAFEQGRTNYRMLCFACHAENGQGTPMVGTDTTLGPPFHGSKRVLGNSERLTRIVLQGLTGPINGKTYPGVMASTAAQTDEWLADTLTYIRNEWGHKASRITASEIAAVRKSTKGRITPWTMEELNKGWGNYFKDRHLWELTSSHTQKDQFKQAVDGNGRSRWQSTIKQEAGMWVAIELDGAAKVKGLNLNGDHPDEVDVDISKDGQTWKQVLSKHRPNRGQVNFKEAVESRYFKITIAKPKNGRHWTINELQLTQAK
jgi:mono/diheme cytochrome c family protein